MSKYVVAVSINGAELFVSVNDNLGDVNSARKFDNAYDAALIRNRWERLKFICQVKKCGGE